jgi:hypothetical protein
MSRTRILAVLTAFHAVFVLVDTFVFGGSLRENFMMFWVATVSAGVALAAHHVWGPELRR